MAIKYHPNPGTVLTCDFSGMIEPEMIKERPVVVISPRLRSRTGLCTIVPISTTPPSPAMKWHYNLSLNEGFSPKWNETDVWVKCDMIYTMRFERLERFHARVADKRKYYDRKLPDSDIDGIMKCVQAFLGL